MNLEKLKIKNINSFEGEFIIDFTLFQRELFLISGPTGSGKSTIIDAILAALYDKTPRLSSAKYLLNKDAKEGEIKLTFFIDSDKFELEWRVKRDKNNNISSPKRALFKNNTLIADKNIDIKREIVKILKLDFPQFTKAVVLAQGEFDAFLSANDIEKIKVLEKILNIKEFELISIRVFEKSKKIKEEIETLLEEVKKLNIDNSQIIQKEKEKNELLEKLNILEKREKELSKLLEYKKKKELLQKDNTQLKNRLKEIQNNISIYRVELEKISIKEKEEKFINEKNSFERELESLNRAILLLNDFENSSKIFHQKEEELKEIKNSIKNSTQKKDSTQIKIDQLKKELLETVIIKDNRLKDFNQIQEDIILYKNLEDEYKEKLNFKTKYQKELNSLNKLRKDQELKKDYLQKELNYLKAKVVVLEYEEERRKLTPNSPCPLCGSTIHPYVTNPPKISQEIKEKYIFIEKEIKNLDKEIETTTQKISLLNDRLENLNLDKIKNRLNSLKEKLKRYNIASFDEFKKLREIKIKNEKNEKKLNQLKLDLTKLEANKRFLEEEIEKYIKREETIKNNLELLKKEIDQIKSQKEFDLEAKNKKEKLKNKFKEIEKEFIKYQNRHNAILQEIKKLSGIKEEIENKIKTNNLELKNIPPISNIDEKEYKKLQKELKDAHTKLGAISQQLIELNEKLLNKKQLEEKIALKKDKFKIIEALNIAIGSADGKKFKKIALNYLMENLLNIANIHLQKITQNRYLFKKSQDLNRLTLYIIDRFYENQEREVTTLSGGEKFLASLALAFGLSDMTSNKSKIDTLFLDEGFGTLDNNSLNLALNILKEASNNKSVGIISHIDALKEEIPYQIRVIKKPNGRSYIKLFS